MKIKVIENSNHRNITYERDYKNKSSKYKGVRFKPNKPTNPYEVRLCLHNRAYPLGTYESEEIAAKVYDIFCKKYVKNPQLNEDLYPELKNFILSENILLWVEDRLKQMDPYILHREKVIFIKKIKSKLPKIKEKIVRKLDPNSLRARLPKETLIELMKTHILKDIASLYNCKRSAITNLLKYYKIPRTDKITRIILKHSLTKEGLEGEIKCGSYPAQLMKKYKFSDSDITRLLKYFNINWKSLYPYKVGTCLNCGKEMLDNPLSWKFPKKYCSERCNKLAYMKRKAKRISEEKERTKVCLVCGNKFLTINTKKIYCGTTCKSKIKKCRTCSKIIISNETICNICKQQEYNKQLELNKSKEKLKQIERLRICKICKSEFISNKHRTLCSEICKKEFQKQKHLEWRSNPGNKQRMRLAHKLYKRKVRSSAYRKREYLLKEEMKTIRKSLKVKKIRNNLKVLKKRLDYFGKDVCCFCNKKITTPNNITIEHLLPISKGGDNNFINLYQSCRECNESKWDKDWIAWFRSQPFYNKKREDMIIKLNSEEWEKLFVE